MDFLIMLQGVIAGLIGNALCGVAAYVDESVEKRQESEQRLREILQKEVSVKTILQRAITSSARKLILDDSLVEELRDFLMLPEVEAIVRQIYASKFKVDQEGSCVDDIREEFLTSLALYLRKDNQEIINLGNFVFDIVLEGCDDALSAAIENGVLSAHEAKSTYRHHITMGELAVIRKNIDFLKGAKSLDIHTCHQFEEQYRKQVGDRHRSITPPNFDSVRKIPIDNLYVSPYFHITSGKEKAPEVIDTSCFFSVVRRTVILGDPGGGKSTFAYKLCHDLAEHYSARLVAGQQLTPILVVLRDYGARKQREDCSILKFIESTANSAYGVSAPPGVFEYMFLNGRALVIFDGLDELLDTSYRQRISDDIESFCNLYPSVPVIVTSRKVGYNQAPLDEERFEVFALSPFNDEQVSDYTRKWFALDQDLASDEKDEKIKAFLDESRIVADLRSNPLMLALMCNIYRGEGYIPQNRPDLYEKCAVMLFERWDKRRGIRTMVPFEAHIRPTIEYLAHAIYSDENLQGGVTASILVSNCADYLCPRRFGDRMEAEEAACKFIELCKGRAWVFTDTGTTKHGEPIYQFTHRTFLEYFTADYLRRTHASPMKLSQVLFPKIAKQEWDVVAQLAFQLLDKNREDAGDQLLNNLVLEKDDKTQLNDIERRNFLFFAARCLGFMVPSPKVTGNITVICLQYIISEGVRQSSAEQESEKRRYHSNTRELLEALTGAVSENRKAIIEKMKEVLVERINRGSELESVCALEIATILPGYANKEYKDGQEFIFRACRARLRDLSQTHRFPALISFYRKMITIADLVEWYGGEELFHGYQYAAFPHTWHYDPASSFLSSCLAGKPKIDVFRGLGDALLGVSPPWLRIKVGPRGHFFVGGARTEDPWPGPFFRDRLKRMVHPHKGEGEGECNLSPDELFAAFGIFAAYLETIPAKDAVEILQKLDVPLLDGFRQTCLSRYERIEGAEVEAELKSCGFTNKQRQFIEKWVRKEINLVEILEQKEEQESDAEK